MTSLEQFLEKIGEQLTDAAGHINQVKEGSSLSTCLLSSLLRWDWLTTSVTMLSKAWATKPYSTSTRETEKLSTLKEANDFSIPNSLSGQTKGLYEEGHENIQLWRRSKGGHWESKQPSSRCGDATEGFQHDKMSQVAYLIELSWR